MTAAHGLDFTGLATLKAAARDAPQAALRSAARQFEGLFLQMVLKAMREAGFGDPLFDSDQTRMYRELFDGELANSLSATGNPGLAELIVRQLGGTAAPSSPTAQVALPAPGLSAPGLPRPPAAAGGGSFSSPADFLRAIWDKARAAAAELGTEARVLVAQAALETGWGRHIPRRPDGSSSHNLFGIKAGAGWRGDRVAVPTLEFRDGVMQRETARFRAYPSLEDSIDDYVRLLQSSPRYHPALAQGTDPRGFTQALQRAGYATDPGYSDKILDILHGDLLGGALREVDRP